MAELVINMQKRGEGDEIGKKNIFACPFCNKEFASGKALGGHKRIHLSLKKKEKIPAELIKIQFFESKPRYYKCSLCPRTLRTEESFQDHKRAHPQRQESNKGTTIEPSKQITRDHNHINSSPSSIDSNALVLAQVAAAHHHHLNNLDISHEMADNLSQILLPSWPRTARRSQKTRARISLPSFEEFWIADDLMMLSQGGVSGQNLPLKKRKMMPYQRSWDYKCKGKSDQTSTSFMCHQCNKSFPSYRALGGHNSHHKKDVPNDNPYRTSTSSGTWRHRCPFCNKYFQRRQALAGHRTHCNYKTPLPITQVAMEEEEEEEEAIEKAIFPTAAAPSKTKAFVIDLNQLPPPEDSEDATDDHMMVEAEKVLALTWHDGDRDVTSSACSVNNKH